MARSHYLIRSSSFEAEAITGFKKSERARRINDGRLPPPIRLGSRATAFVVAELEAINAARAAGASDADIRGLVIGLVAARPHRAAQALAEVLRAPA